MARVGARATAVAVTGTSNQIMKGLKAWNQVTGICPAQNSRLMVRSVLPSAPKSGEQDDHTEGSR